MTTPPNPPPTTTTTPATPSTGTAPTIDLKNIGDAVGLYKKLKETIIDSNDKINQFTTAQMLGFSQVNAYLAETNNLFNNLGKADFSTGFIEQYNSIRSVVSKTMSELNNIGIGGVFEKLKSFGLDKIIPIDIIGKGVEAVDDYMKKQLAAADAGLRLRDSIISNASASGNLGVVYQKSGEQLTNINAYLADYNEIITKASKATNTLPSEVEKYISALSKLPGFLENYVSLTADGNEQTDMLAATINFARGAGRDYSEVISDMEEAMNDYNATSNQAIDYVARMSEVTNKLGINFSIVRGFVKDIGDTLGKFGNNTDASARILLKYVGALREAGASGKQSADMLNTMTKSIAGMSMAQKGFLSARSGGPGGLVGALQIEDMMRKNQTDKVLEMVMKDLTKQFGKVVTMDEALKDPRLAAQFKRQRMMLTKGPYGSLFGTEQDATKGLDMFSKVQSGKISMKEAAKALGNQSIGAELINRGQDLTQQTATTFGLAGIDLANLQRGLSIQSLNTAQDTLAATSGNADSNTRIQFSTGQAEMKSNLLQSMSAAKAEGANNIIENNNKNPEELYKDSLSSKLYGTTRDLVTLMEKNLKPTFASPIDNINNVLGADGVTQAKSKENFEKELAKEQRNAQVPRARAMIPEAPVQKEKKELREDQKVKVQVDLTYNGKQIESGSIIADLFRVYVNPGAR